MTEIVDIAPTHDRELVIARLVDASPEALYRVWTDPARYPEWFCPKPWRAEVDKMDLRPGGAADNTMYGPDGEVMKNHGVYLEIVPNQKIVFTDAFTEGWLPVEGGGMMTAVLTFEAQPDGRTLYIARCGHPTLEQKTQHEQMGFHDGWGICADQMEAVAKTL
jgi:uncharacterized protein YndB with AHSA1/START domain